MGNFFGGRVERGEGLRHWADGVMRTLKGTSHNQPSLGMQDAAVR